MGRESRTRKLRAQERQEPVPVVPEQLLKKYRVEPIAGLPEPVQKFHLKIVTDVLEGHDGAARPGGALQATHVWHKHHDGLAGSRPGRLNFGGVEKQLACASGCNHCCRSPVGVVAAEAMLVAQVVERTFPEHERLALRRRMEDRKAALQGGDSLQIYLCPLNVDGRCTVYESRPYNCRVFHSFDVDACAERFLGGERDRSLPIDPVRRKYDRLIVASANIALTALGLDTRMLEFMAALETALDAGADRLERHAAGEDLFTSLPTIVPPSAGEG